MKTFWECDCLAFEDLPTVGDLIWDADWDILAREVTEVFREEHGIVSVDAVKAALDDMTARPPLEPSSKWLFLPFEYFDYNADFNTIDWKMDAALVRRRDFKVMCELGEAEVPLLTAQECREALSRDNTRLGDDYPNFYSWALRSWDKVLSFRVWLQGGYSRRERYRLIAMVVYEMMAYGDTWEQARVEQRRVKKSLKASRDRLKSGDVECRPTELLFGNYGLESSTDDYYVEYQNRAHDIAFVQNYNASVDLHRRIAHLVRLEKRAQKHRATTG